MRPANVNLYDHTLGDTWEGMVIGPVLINDAVPPDPVISCRIQFRPFPNTRKLGYELNVAPESGEGLIVIDDINNWEFTVPQQILDMPAGKYVWDFETTDSAGIKRTLYEGTFNLIQDVTYG